jgi:thiol-disulfide isomerase/thioredoxin
MLPRLFLKSHWRRIAAALAVCALVALAVSCELDGASKKRAEEARLKAATPQAPRTNLPLPPVASSHGADAAPAGAWTQPDGRRVRLEDLRGQVVVLDFWATYCPPCREEIPHLVRLQKQHGPQGFKVIGLNVGGEEDRPKVPDFVKTYGIQYQLGEPDEETARLFLSQDDSIPQTYIFDRNGRLVDHVTGYDEEVGRRIDNAVAQALAEKAD